MKINFEETPKFTADFETATWLDNETYVWAWATYNIDHGFFNYGNNIADFFELCKYYHNPIVYMHNLRFDRGIYHLVFKHAWLFIYKRQKRQKELYLYNIN